MYIDLATISDLSEIQTVQIDAYGGEYFTLLTLRQYIDLFPSSFFIMKDPEAQHKIIAAAICGLDETKQHSWLLSLVVSPPYQKRGFGGQPSGRSYPLLE